MLKIAKEEERMMAKRALEMEKLKNELMWLNIKSPQKQ